MKRCFWLEVAGIGSGKVVWEFEQRMCASHPHVWPLHVLWHFLSCVGGVYATLYNAHLRAACLGDGYKDARKVA
jgi:dihydroceramidase